MLNKLSKTFHAKAKGSVGTVSMVSMYPFQTAILTRITMFFGSLKGV